MTGTQRLSKELRGRGASYHRPNGHEASFWCLETKVDGFCVLADDNTAARIVSTSKEEVVVGGSH